MIDLNHDKLTPSTDPPAKSEVLADLAAYVQAESANQEAEELALESWDYVQQEYLRAEQSQDKQRIALCKRAIAIQRARGMNTALNALTAQEQTENDDDLSALTTLTAQGSTKFEAEPEDQRWPNLSIKAIPPGIVADFIDLACSNSEADPAAVLGTFLVRFGIECGAGPHVLVGESRHTARCNAAIVGESAKARKGTSAGPVKSLFSGFDGCRVSPGPLSSGEGIIYAVRDEVMEWRPDKKTGNGSWIVADPGVTDKRLFVQDEEFANALSATKREGNTLSSILRCLYDDGNAEPLTKSNRIKATGAHVGILTHITIFELKARLTQNEQLNGFGNRFLWVCARRNGIVPFPEPMNEARKQLIQAQLIDRIGKALVLGRTTFTPEARELWACEYPGLSMSHSGLAGCMVNRAEAHVIRLSLIYSLLAGHSSIEVQDLEAALAFWQYCHDSAFYIFDGAPTDRRKMRVLDALKTQPRMTRNEIREQVFSRHISSDGLTVLLREMQDEHLIELATEPTGGAPRTIVILKRAGAISAISAESPPEPLCGDSTDARLCAISAISPALESADDIHLEVLDES